MQARRTDPDIINIERGRTIMYTVVHNIVYPLSEFIFFAWQDVSLRGLQTIPNKVDEKKQSNLVHFKGSLINRKFCDNA